MSVDGLKRLKVWVRAKDIALRVYKEVVPLLPAEEKWNLAQQLRRASLSVSANIAEGHGRFHYQDNIRFCYTARGSLQETLSHLEFGYEAGYIPANLHQELATEGEELAKMLNGYIAHLRKSKQGMNDSTAGLAAREEARHYSSECFETPIESEQTTLYSSSL